MSSPSERPTNEQTRTYDRASSVVFLKTDEPFGGLSNMAGGYPLHVQGVRINTSEALYQACRFPHMPEVQRLIIGQTSPMTAKMKSKPYRKDSRPDWDRVRVRVMRWCLRVKLAQNWTKFSELLLRTGDRPIVEESRRDDFWGAKPVDERTLTGMNVLGRLLMELREAVKAQAVAAFQAVEPLDIPEFQFLGRPIGTVGAHELDVPDAAATSTARAPGHGVTKETAEQGSLFDTAAAREGPPPAYVTAPTPASTPLGELKPYPAMKDSGVPWLGEVPEHWSVERLKSSVSNVIDQTVERRSGELYIALEHVESWTGLVRLTGPDVVFDSQVKRFRAGDVLFGKLRPYLAKVTRAPSDGVCVGEFLVLRPRESDGSALYLEQLLRSKPVIDAVNSSTFGAKMPRADWQFVGSMPIAFPPLPEQAAIVRFLDHADRRIRRYIRAKQKLIKLLEEQKQAIIHRAVTRGLDPTNSPGANFNAGHQAGGPKGEGRDSPSNVRLKPSGVEWLGDVPEHWEVVPLKFLSERIQNGATPPTSEVAFYENGVVPWYGPSSCAQGEDVGAPVRHLAKAAFTAGRARLIHHPALLVVVIGATAGRMALLPHDGATNQQITSYELRTKRVFPRFVLHQLRSAERWLRSTASTATIPILDGSVVSRLLVAIPSVIEQESIVRCAGEDTAGLARVIDRARREIDLLREYRTRLIADVVTGKLDVREAAARLPDAGDEPEPLDEDVAETDGEKVAADDADAATAAAEA